ncbi:hypothetical protein HK098_000623 [Nowakowskiella sp. JEL0407]|nr:hypothetical protein HK098_000623 [Nowakowskiella sp. JEL0407]
MNFLTQLNNGPTDWKSLPDEWSEPKPSSLKYLDQFSPKNTNFETTSFNSMIYNDNPTDNLLPSRKDYSAIIDAAEVGVIHENVQLPSSLNNAGSKLSSLFMPARRPESWKKEKDNNSNSESRSENPPPSLFDSFSSVHSPQKMSTLKDDNKSRYDLSAPTFVKDLFSKNQSSTTKKKVNDLVSMLDKPKDDRTRNSSSKDPSSKRGAEKISNYSAEKSDHATGVDMHNEVPATSTKSSKKASRTPTNPTPRRDEFIKKLQGQSRAASLTAGGWATAIAQGSQETPLKQRKTVVIKNLGNNANMRNGDRVVENDQIFQASQGPEEPKTKLEELDLLEFAEFDHLKTPSKTPKDSHKSSLFRTPSRVGTPKSGLASQQSQRSRNLDNFLLEKQLQTPERSTVHNYRLPEFDDDERRPIININIHMTPEKSKAGSERKLNFDAATQLSKVEELSDQVSFSESFPPITVMNASTGIQTSFDRVQKSDANVATEPSALEANDQSNLKSKSEFPAYSDKKLEDYSDNFNSDMDDFKDIKGLDYTFGQLESAMASLANIDPGLSYMPQVPDLGAENHAATAAESISPPRSILRQSRTTPVKSVANTASNTPSKVASAAFVNSTPNYKTSPNYFLSSKLGPISGTQFVKFLNASPPAPSHGIMRDSILAHVVDALHMPDEWAVTLEELDLSNRDIMSVEGLKRIAPQLKSLKLSNNQLTYLTGIPITVNQLDLDHNQISPLTSFSALTNLQYLNVSHNELVDLSSLSNLHHLRELDVSHNQLDETCCAVLAKLLFLQNVNLNQNKITTLLGFRDPLLLNERTLNEKRNGGRIELLSLESNLLKKLDGLENMSQLKTLIIANNKISKIEINEDLSNLEHLDLSRNNLTDFDARHFPSLVTLNISHNRLTAITNEQRLTKLQILYLQHQNTDKELRREHHITLKVKFNQIPALRILNVSGNKIGSLRVLSENHRLEKLQARACQLQNISKRFLSSISNLVKLDLAQNYLADISNLRNSASKKRLRQLDVSENRIDQIAVVLRALKELTALESIDIRYNVFNSKYYPSVQNEPSGSNQQYDSCKQRLPISAELDNAFQQKMTDAEYVRRRYYRASIINLHPKSLQHLDNIRITDHDRKRAKKMLQKLKKQALENQKKELEEEPEN